MKVCPKCGREFGNSSVRCPICKIGLEQMGEKKKEPQRMSGVSRSQTAGRNMTRIDNETRGKEQVQAEKYMAESRNKEKPSSPSALSIIALIFSLLGCMAFIGAILAIVDLCIKDGKKKVCSILALIFCGIWLAIAGIGSIASGDRDSKKESSSEIQQPERNSYEESAEEEKTKDYDFDTQEEKQEDQPNTIPATEAEPKETYLNGLEFEYADTHVKYLKHEVVENMAGDKCLAVYYEFTNNSDENETFMYLFSDKAFQNGVELDGSIFHVADESKNSSREIQPGTTVTVVSGFVLSDESSNVTLQVEPMITFTNEKLLELDLSL